MPRRLALSACLLLLALPSLTVAQPAAGPVVVPIKEVDLTDGTRRYMIPITVGATRIEAGLDTGSSGLRILPDTLGAADATETKTSDDYSYGSGAELHGVVGQANVAIGDGAAAPMSVQIIKSVGCIARLPNCPVSKVSAKDYRIQGDGLAGQGFRAIIGVNMAEAEVRSPLIAAGAKRWIIDLPLPGSSRPGQLILNPTPEQTKGYTMFKIDPAFRGQKGGMHDAIAGCLYNERSKQQFCGPTLLDSGAPGINIVNADAGAVWPNETPVTLAFLDGGKAVTGMKMLIGRREQASRLQYTPRPDAPGVRLQPGIAPYFGFSVLYDPEADAIGLKPR
jgi:hypothetical protein